MKISKWGEGMTLDKQPGMMVSVSKTEALRLIKSLTMQMLKNNPNLNRVEMHTADGEYFSISVDPE